VPAIRGPEDYEHCVLEILRAVGGRASWGQLFTEFQRRYTSSIPRDEERPAGRVGSTPRWQRGLEEAVGRLAERKRVYRPDPELVELT
jgi:hypothetical protein